MLIQCQFQSHSDSKPEKRTPDCSTDAGTVIAAGNSLIVAADSVGFKQRTLPPTVGQGFQVIGKLQGDLGGSLQLIDDSGAPITTSGAAKPAVGTSG